MRLIVGTLIALVMLATFGAILIGELCGWREDGE